MATKLSCPITRCRNQVDTDQTEKGSGRPECRPTGFRFAKPVGRLTCFFFLLLPFLTINSSATAQDARPPFQLSPILSEHHPASIPGTQNAGVGLSLEHRLQETESRLRDLERELLRISENRMPPAEHSERWKNAFHSTLGGGWQDIDQAQGTVQSVDAPKTDEQKKADEEQKKAEAEKKTAEEPKPEKKWYEKIGMRGYTQVRFNEVLVRDDDSAPPQHVGDRSVSENQELFIRRARLILFGDISDHMYIYLQPDFSITPTGSTDATHFVQMRDWYADLYLDTTKVHRIRAGQSKIPYGWENLQSSSNRLPLDRADALNSAARNERDLGVFYYYTPEYAQTFFKSVVDDGLKGSGNYGMFGLGAYNGQGGSFQEQNDNMHLISRLTLPMTFCDGQKAEVAVQGYTGRYVVHSALIRPLGLGPAIRPTGTLETGDNRGILDQRGAVTAVWYPQPLGFQAEWNVGRGPGLSEDQTTVEERSLYGGYLMTMYRHETENRGVWIPFLRWSYYKGGYKSERNAPFSLIDEWELGLEWQINTQMELVGMYTLTDRTNTTALSGAGDRSYQQFDGSLLRLQFQFNY